MVKRLVESSLETVRTRTVIGKVGTKTILHGLDLQWTTEQNKQEQRSTPSCFTVKEDGAQKVAMCVLNLPPEQLN